jgi:hypothetical protein
MENKVCFKKDEMKYIKGKIIQKRTRNDKNETQ